MNDFFSKHLTNVKNLSGDKVVDVLNRTGIITFVDVYEIDHFLEICNHVGNIYNHPDADLNGLTSITNRTEGINRGGVKGFTQKSLIPHTDRATVVEPPFYTSLLCINSSAHGGNSILVDGLEVYNHMKNYHLHELSLLEKPEVVIFGKGIEQYSGAIFSNVNSTSKYIRFRFDDLAYFSAEIIEATNVFLSTVYTYQHEFKLEPGQGYIVQNGRWLHGRDSYEGNRLMYRALINSKGSRENFGFLIN